MPFPTSWSVPKMEATVLRTVEYSKSITATRFFCCAPQTKAIAKAMHKSLGIRFMVPLLLTLRT